MIIEKPPHTPHLRRIFVFEHELPRMTMNFHKLKTMLLASNQTPLRPAGTPPLVMGGECLADTS